MIGSDGEGVLAWDRPVFIITTGRSGSTLLLRYLNCAEGLVVWGEHAGVLRELSEAYRRLTSLETTTFVEAARPWVADLKAKRAVVCPRDQMTIEWVNGFDHGIIQSAFRSLLLALFAADLPRETRWGFKEIHYGRDEIALLRELFIAPRFLILLRDPAAILKSKLEAFAKGNAAAMAPHVAETRAFFESAAAEARQAPRDVLFVRYERLTAAPEEELDRISRFIEAPFGAEAVRSISDERAGRSAPVRLAPSELTALAKDLGLPADDIDAIVAHDRELDALLASPRTAAPLAA
jgi:hypothetical protein